MVRENIDKQSGKTSPGVIEKGTIGTPKNFPERMDHPYSRISPELTRGKSETCRDAKEMLVGTLLETLELAFSNFGTHHLPDPVALSAK